MPAVLRFSLFSLFLLVFAGQSKVAAQDYVFPNKGVIHQHSEMTLSRKQARKFREFRKSTAYFGAFVASTDGEVSFFTINHHSLRGARLFPEISCELHVKKRGTGECVLIATLRPDRPMITPIGELSVSSTLAASLKENLSFLKSFSGVISLAANEAATYGSSGVKNTESEAKEEALRRCEEASLFNFREARKANRKAAEILSVRGYFRCEFVFSFVSQ